MSGFTEAGNFSGVIRDDERLPECHITTALEPAPKMSSNRVHKAVYTSKQLKLSIQGDLDHIERDKSVAGKSEGLMGSDGGLEGLQKRLRVFHASYEAGQKSDSVKRRAMRQSLGAVIDFLMAQPNWGAADSALLVTLAEALADVEKGHTTSLISKKPLRRSPAPAASIRRRRAQAAAHMEQLMRRGLSREEAARKVFREIPRNSSLFENKEDASWRTVAHWLDEISASPRNGLERKSFEAALRQREFDFSE